MRVLILGGDGMLGHQLLAELASGHQAVATLRQDADAYRAYGLFSSSNAIYGVDATDTIRLAETLHAVKPEAVVNAIGIVKQDLLSSDIMQNLEVNALLPHRLAALCKEIDARLVHISTDCVFSGARGAYLETDEADARDLYGRAKFLGEVEGPGCVTLRTSMIGLELKRRKSLVEWFLAQRGKVPGYVRAIYSGLTTPELSRVIRLLLESFPRLDGLFQVVANPISKHDILTMLTTTLGRNDVAIERDERFSCDRSMVGEKFRKATGYLAPSWPILLAELALQIKQRPAP